MTNKITKATKRIPREHWQAFCSTFTNGNRGRLLSIEIFGDDAYILTPATSTPFAPLNFYSYSKDVDFVIFYGSEVSTTSHSISGPVDLWEAQDVNG